MATGKQRITEILTPLAEGEFRRITGIGEATEKRLHDNGIDTFDHLASLTPVEIASVLTGQVGVKERAAGQDWIGQARKFAEELAAEELAKDERRIESIESAERQHYESFLVELLIDDDRNVRRTRVTQVRGGTKDYWAGWDSERLLNWIAAQTGIPTESFSSAVPVNEAAAPGKSAARITGSVFTTNLTLCAKGSDRARRFYTSGQPLELQLTLDLSKTVIPPGFDLAYIAAAKARQIDTGRRILLGEIQGECPATDQMVLTIPIEWLEEGTYSLETVVQLWPAGSLLTNGDSLRAMSEGGLFHIYARDLEPAV